MPVTAALSCLAGGLAKRALLAAKTRTTCEQIGQRNAVKRRYFLPHMTTQRQRGQAGEDAAALFLEFHGYRIIERNWRPRNGAGSSQRGEVDCIAWQGRVLCFVEVKTRSGASHGAPQEAVTTSKQRQICKLANAYVSLHRITDTPCRFDVVEVWASAGDDNAARRIALRQNAFDYVESGTSRQRGARIF